MDLRGPSAEAVAELAEHLAGRSGSADLATVGTDLFTVAATLRTEGALRRFVTDASLPSEARTGLVREVFGAKVDDATLEVLTGAASRRWTAARDLAPGLEHLGVVATVRSADDGSRLSDELFAVDRAVRGNGELRDALSDPARSDDDKTALVDDLIGSQALPATTVLVKQAVVGSHRTVGTALTAYQQVAADVQDERVATVHVARELSTTDHDRLAAALASQYGRDVHLNVVVDPEVIGGIKVEIGDDVIDGTVAARLGEARRLLAG